MGSKGNHNFQLSILNSQLEIIVVINCYAATCRNVAAHTSGAVEAGACSCISYLQAVTLVVEGHGSHVVVCLCSAAVIHIAYGEHPVRLQRQLHESESPVALIAGGGELLKLAAQRDLFVELIFTLGNEDVRVNHASFTLDNTFVVALVHIHKVQFKALR